MLILDLPRPYTRGRIALPTYHRTHVSLASGVTVSMCYVPPSEGNSTALAWPELIISPIDHQRWGNLWRMFGTFKDRTSLIADLLDEIRLHNVNVINAESATITRKGVHTVELLLDIPIVVDDQVYGSQTNLARRLYDDLLRRLLQDLTYSRGQPRVSMRAMVGLRRAMSTITSINETGKSTANVSQTDLKIEEGRLVMAVPAAIDKEIRRVLNPAGEKTARFKYLRLSDTRERYLSVRFLKADVEVRTVRIRHRERPGAIATIVAALARNGADVLTLRSSILQHHSDASTEITLLLPDTEHDIAGFVEGSLKAPECRELELAFGFPTSYSKLPRMTEVSALFPPPSAIVAEHDRPVQSTGSPGEVMDRLTSAMSDRLLSEDEQCQFNVSRYLLSRSESDSAFLFVSCHFSDPNLRTVVRNRAESRQFQFRVLFGDNLAHYSELAEGVVESIRRCSHFLGIWSHEGSQDAHPSAWLPWELGVANAFRRPWRLLVSKQISKEYAISLSRQRQILFFSEHDFSEQLERALEALKTTNATSWVVQTTPQHSILDISSPINLPSDQIGRVLDL